MHCLRCGAETSNGLALCALCQQKARSCLDVLPLYFRHLTRWRPGHAGSRPVPGSRVPASVLNDGKQQQGTGDQISDAVDEVWTMLTTWGRALTNDRPHFPRPLTLADAVLTDDMSTETSDMLADDQAQAAALLCAAFEHHLTSISTLDWCDQFVDQLGEAEKRLSDLTNYAMPGWYAGLCRRCKVPTYVMPGRTWITCLGCGASTHAADHLEIILEEAKDWVARPKAIADAIVKLIDTEQDIDRLSDRIRKWGERGKLEPVRRTGRDYVWDEPLKRFIVTTVPTGLARYRLGDVLDLVLPKRATRQPKSRDRGISA